jgi:superfamily II DNA or RNA helicase
LDGILNLAHEIFSSPTSLARVSSRTNRQATGDGALSDAKSSHESVGNSPAILPIELSAWARDLIAIESGSDTPAPTRSRTAKHRIIFILAGRNSYNGPLLRVDIYKAPVRKDGSFGRLESYDPLLSRRMAAFATPQDLEVFRLLAGFGFDDRYRTTEITDEFTTRTLKTIVETGKCYFGSPILPALHWGETRKGTLDWSVDDHFNLHPCVAVNPPGLVFQADPLVYIDPGQNSIGYVETDVARPFAHRWISAPPVAPAHYKAISAFTRNQNLPVPPPLPEPERIVDAPQPVIRFFSGPRHSYLSGANQVVIDPENYVHWAEVRFEYGPISLIPDHDMEMNIDRNISGKRYQLQRDQAAERARRKELDAAGLIYVHRAGYHPATARNDIPIWIAPYDLSESCETWIDEKLPRLEAAGWKIEFDPSCILRKAKATDWFMDIGDSQERGQDWFNIDLGIVVDGERVSLLPIMRKILSDPHLPTNGAKGGMMVALPDHRCIRIPMKRLAKIRELLIELYSINPDADGPLMVDRLRAAQFAGVDGWRWSGSERVRALVKKLTDANVAPVAPPTGLKATLRPYQLQGLNWLQFLRECDLAGVLADDMGLGKTVQTLAHLLAEKQAGRLDQPALVVAPTSLMGNWRDETQRFAPDLRLLVFHGSDRHEQFERLSNYDLIVTSYPLLARDKDTLTRQAYHMLILDEAQMIKNPATQYAQAARKLTTRHRLALTGTPMENHLGELWAIFDFLMPGFLGNYRQFRTLFRDPIEKGDDPTRRQILAKRVAPLILRRRKSEVALELPPKNVMIQSIEISGAQRDVYESIRVSMESRVRDQIASMGLARSHIVILDALLKLRQVCCDPRLLKIPGARDIKESAKLEWLVEALPPMVEEGRKILLFSQFTSMLDLIEDKLNELNIRFVRLSGDTRDRDTPVDAFQSGDVPLFLISLKAGGTGLNLTAADTVIHYDPWWNPAVENQATDRAHRIGQGKTVFVYKLITRGTVEEKIQALQDRKAQLLAGLLDETGQSTLKLGEEDLQALFAPLS